MSLGYVGANIFSLLTDDAIIAGWNNEGLPSDAMSTENASILTHSVKWPLMIDPQLQGLKWIKNKYGKSLKVTSTDPYRSCAALLNISKLLRLLRVLFKLEVGLIWFGEVWFDCSNSVWLIYAT